MRYLPRDYLWGRIIVGAARIVEIVMQVITPQIDRLIFPHPISNCPLSCVAVTSLSLSGRGHDEK